MNESVVVPDLLTGTLYALDVPARAPVAAKVQLRHRTTGAVIERWPADAREITAGGEWELCPTTDPPQGA